MLNEIGPRIAPQTKLWRYIRLSTLLLLLTKKRVFVPSIETLRKHDPTEASVLCGKTHSHFRNLDKESVEWLATLRKKGTRGDPLSIWMAQIVQRRCAWCWHNAPIESMGLWHIYAKEGVAICTTPERLRRCLTPNKYFKAASIGSVEYHMRGTAVDGSDVTLLRPYMIKQKCYEYEKEVRVIFPVTRQHRGGLTLPFHPSELIEEIAISPYMPQSEAAALRHLVTALYPTLRCEPSEALDADQFRSHLREMVQQAGQSREAWDELMYGLGVAKFGIIKRLPSVMKRA